MIITLNQTKAREMLWEKYLEEDWYILFALIKLFSKEEKWETENRLQKVKICYIWNETLMQS